MKLNVKVVYGLVREIAKELEQEDRFKADPEAYAIGLLVAANKGLLEGYESLDGGLEQAVFEDVQEEVIDLLGRKKTIAK